MLGERFPSPTPPTRCVFPWRRAKSEAFSCKRREKLLRDSSIATCTWESWRRFGGRKHCRAHNKPGWWWSWDNKGRRRSPTIPGGYTSCTTLSASEAPRCCTWKRKKGRNVNERRRRKNRFEITASRWWWRRVGWRTGSWLPSTPAASPGTFSSFAGPPSAAASPALSAPFYEELFWHLMVFDY